MSFQYISFSFTRVICCFLKRKFCANVKKYHIGETWKCQPKIILKDRIICGQTSGFRSASHSPTLTFNTADRPHHPLPSHRQGSPQSSFNLHSCASSCGEYCGEDSIPGSQVFSQSHRLSCRNTKCRLTPCCRQNGCSRALPEPAEVAAVSKTSACVNALSLWGIGRVHGSDPETLEQKNSLGTTNAAFCLCYWRKAGPTALGTRASVLENWLRYLGGQYKGFLSSLVLTITCELGIISLSWMRNSVKKLAPGHSEVHAGRLSRKG